VVGYSAAVEGKAEPFTIAGVVWEDDHASFLVLGEPLLSTWYACLLRGGTGITRWDPSDLSNRRTGCNQSYEAYKRCLPHFSLVQVVFQSDRTALEARHRTGLQFVASLFSLGLDYG